MGCGRESGGDNAAELGVCPAASEERLNGVHGGSNAGRACWAVAGTMCGEEPSGTFSAKTECLACPFYRSVLDDEAPHIVYTPAILVLLESPPAKAPFLAGPQRDDD
jgi:hypothetical protein